MKRFKNILLVISDTLQDDKAIETAVKLAKSNKANLSVLKVIEEPSVISSFFTKYDLHDLLEKDLKDKQDKIYSELSVFSKDIDIEIILARGKAYYEIIRVVLQNGFDLVIKTCSHLETFKSMLLGSTDMHLLRKCPCPVWLIKPEGELKFSRILAAVDIQPAADEEKMEALNGQILEMSTSLALSELAELHIVHAWMIFGEELRELSDRTEGLEQEVDEWVKQQKSEIEARRNANEKNVYKLLGENGSDYIQPMIHFINGDASEVIPKLSKEKNVDLVIMGTIARTGIPGMLMGNTAENILNDLDCSVLAIKPEGFVSPITI